MQGFATMQSTPRPFAVTKPGSSAATFTVADPIAVIWSTGGTDTYGVGTVVGTVDSVSFAWLLLAVQGAGLQFQKEKDRATFNTIYGTTPWSILWRVADGTDYPIPGS